MVKYALILAFSYPRVEENTLLTFLSCAHHDIKMTHGLCSSLEIDDKNITILTDINDTPNSISECNVKRNPYPSDIFVCREICQFLENTIRGIEEQTYKDGNDYPEVFLYISGHGSHIKINDKIEQSIILYNESGTHLKYLLSKDIFNILFGNLHIESDGTMEIPVWISKKSYIQVETETEIKYIPEDIGTLVPITVQLTPPVNSPMCSPNIHSKPYRSSYLANRGIPFSSKMLIVVDTCYSEHMTHFPYIYDSSSQTMIETFNSNVESSSILPHCVTISSCEANKKSGCESSGSSLTKILFMKLKKFKGRLNISQLHYIIYNSNNNLVNNILKNGLSHPIITSTKGVSNEDIPFFNNFVQKKHITIEK